MNKKISVGIKAELAVLSTIKAPTFNENSSAKMWSLILCVAFGGIVTSAQFAPPGVLLHDPSGVPSILINAAHSGQQQQQQLLVPKLECPESKDRCRLSAEQNKEIVLDFYNQVFIRRNFSAVDIYYDPNLIQHNPYIGDGKNPFMEYVSSSKPAPVQIYRPVAQCDLVYLHVKSEDDEKKPIAIVDMFRLECGTIVEHWDVIQEVPAKSENPRSMF